MSVARASSLLVAVSRQTVRLSTARFSTGAVALRGEWDQNRSRGNGGYNSGRGGGYQGQSEGGYKNRSDRYMPNHRGGRPQKRFNPRSDFRDSERDQDAVISRNRLSNKGKEGDGLMGLDDYEVDVTKLKTLEWTDLMDKTESPQESAEEGAEANENTESASTTEVSGFSGIPTLALAAHKVVSRVLVNSLHYNRKYTQLTPVQAQTLIPIMRNESVVVRAKTGTGKTAAFAIPTLQKILEAKRRGETGVKAVIISPTRELAQQIADEIANISSYGELRTIKTQCFVGGLSKQRQVDLGFRRGPVADLIVATPGRLLDILNEDPILEHFKSLQFKVLDEADRLLDAGFKDELDQIRDRLNEVTDAHVPTLLFSATIDNTVRSFAKAEFGGRAKIVDTVAKNEPGAAELVDQHATVCHNWAEMYTAGVEYVEKELAEVEASKDRPFKAIVFLPSVSLVDNYAQLLKMYFNEHGHRNNFVHALHGQMTQARRQRVSDSFRKSRETILVTTDVVARGMDFPQVTHVIQVGPPQSAASYIHRIGRTARIGNSGKSMLIMTQFEDRFLEQLENDKVIIKNITKKYVADEEVAERTAAMVPKTVLGSEEANDLYNNVLSSIGTTRRQLRIDSRGYLNAHRSFADLLGLETPSLSGPNQSSWSGRGQFSRNRNERGSFNGSSRRSRMRW